jgi:hypothetical protein
MDTPEKCLLTGLVIVTGDNGAPIYEEIKTYRLKDFRNFTTPPNTISGETYIPRPFIVSYISGHYIRQYN